MKGEQDDIARYAEKVLYGNKSRTDNEIYRKVEEQLQFNLSNVEERVRIQLEQCKSDIKLEQKKYKEIKIFLQQKLKIYQEMQSKLEDELERVCFMRMYLQEKYIEEGAHHSSFFLFRNYEKELLREMRCIIRKIALVTEALK